MQALPDLIPFDPNALLLGYQKRWVADTSQLKIAEKSRRTGLTWAEAADDVMIASLAKSEGGSDVFYIGSNKEMAREFIDACAMWAAQFNRAAGQIQEELFKDEDKVLKAALALTMWGAKVRLISTHNGVDNLFNQLIQDSRAGRKSYSIHTITLDDACAEGLYQRICQVSKQPWTPEKEAQWKAGLLRETATEDDALEEYYCVPKASSGAYIPRPVIERAATEGKVKLRFECDAKFMEWTEDERTVMTTEVCLTQLLPHLQALHPDRRHAFGVDFARSADLSVYAVCAVQPDTARHFDLTLEIKNCPYNQQKQIMLFMLANLPRFIGAAFDATGNGGYLAEAALIRYGSSMVEAVQLNEKWYREWMPKYKALYESGYIQIPKDEEIILDHGHIQVINGVPKIDKARSKDKSGKRHGDSAVAYCMAVRASYMTGGEIDFIPLPDKHSDRNNDEFNDFMPNDWDW